MLILSRRPGDAILIDGGIRIVVLASDQRTVRLGIEAPSKVGILREEIAVPLNGGSVETDKLVRTPRVKAAAEKTAAAAAPPAVAATA